MPTRRAEPGCQHKKINIQGAETLSQHPSVIADLIVDYAPGLTETTYPALLCARLIRRNIRKPIWIIVKLEGILDGV